MAFKAKALRGYTLHTPGGFVIFNEGKETANIPDEYRARLERNGVIPKSGGSTSTRTSAPRRTATRTPAARTRTATAAPAGDFNAGRFTVTKAEGIGQYQITGPGLDAPVTVKGKAKTQARLDTLNADLGGAGGGAPTE